MNVHKTMVLHFGGKPVLTLQEPLIYPAMLESIKIISARLMEIIDSILEYEGTWTSDRQKSSLRKFLQSLIQKKCVIHTRLLPVC